MSIDISVLVNLQGNIIFNYPAHCLFQLTGRMQLQIYFKKINW